VNIQEIKLYWMIGRFALDKQLLSVPGLCQFAFHSFLKNLGRNRQGDVRNIVTGELLPGEIEDGSGH
jgi:hypothetical protein